MYRQTLVQNMSDMSYMNKYLKTIVSSLAYKILQKMQTRVLFEATTSTNHIIDMEKKHTSPSLLQSL